MTAGKFVTKHMLTIESVQCRIQGTMTGLCSSYINLVACSTCLGFTEIVMHWLVNCTRSYFLLTRDVFVCDKIRTKVMCTVTKIAFNIFNINVKIIL
jgi:hypothetical protein